MPSVPMVVANLRKDVNDVNGYGPRATHGQSGLAESGKTSTARGAIIP